MDSNFNRAFDYTLRNEGGYSNHKDDSGGATKYGITISTLKRWRNAPCTDGDVQTLTRDEAKEIYREWYWNPLRLDEVELLVVATVTFDAGVLFGVKLAAYRLQKVALTVERSLKVDGIVGPKTLTALNKMQQSTFVIGFQKELRERINEVIIAQPKNEVFRNGWHNRIDRFTTLIS